MTKRLYQIDPYQTTFESTVLRRFPEGERIGIVLAETCFYPTSGGQYADHGVLGGLPVEDVRSAGDEIVHVVPEDPEGDRLVGSIDWDRRFDHMQQHSGQHVLSQSFLRILDLNTVSSHLGTEVSTIELPTEKISASDLRRVEDAANEIVFECRSLRAVQMTSDEAREQGVRKLPDHEGVLRIVEVEDYDLSACGGTHCRSTGEIGLIKVGGAERIRKQTRVEFLCGRRALRDYQNRWDWLEDASRHLGRRASDLPAEVRRLVEEGDRQQKQAARLEKNLLEYRARGLLGSARTLGNVRIVHRVIDDLSPEGMATLAGLLVEQADVVALLGLRTEKGHLVAARSEGIGLDLGVMLKETVEKRSGRGGGRPSFARGGTDPPEVEPALRDLLEAVEAALQLDT